jgi:hypothetical protein
MAKKKGPRATDAVPAVLPGYELEARRGTRLDTVAVLRGGRTPLQVIEAAGRAAAAGDRAVQDMKEKYPPPDLVCKDGCDWCCHLEVGTAVPEVLRIAAFLREHLTADELQALRERVARLDDLRRERKAGQRGDPRLPCALLVEHRCTAYGVRPLTCRGCNSTDVSACETAVTSGAKFTVPGYEPQHRLAAFVLDGLRAGLTESRLNGDLLELTAALRIALDQPEAGARWLASEAVFTPARMN